MISTEQGEAEPRAVSCVELSRAELQYFTSVLLFSIWACVDRETGEMMLRKEKPRNLERLTLWEMVHSFGQYKHQDITSPVYSKYYLHLKIKFKMEFKIHSTKVINCSLQEHCKASNKGLFLGGLSPSANMRQAKV